MSGRSDSTFKREGLIVGCRANIISVTLNADDEVFIFLAQFLGYQRNGPASFFREIPLVEGKGKIRETEVTKNLGRERLSW